MTYFTAVLRLRSNSQDFGCANLDAQRCSKNVNKNNSLGGHFAQSELMLVWRRWLADTFQLRLRVYRLRPVYTSHTIPQFHPTSVQLFRSHFTHVFQLSQSLA